MNETFMKEKPVLPLLISMSLPYGHSSWSILFIISWTVFSWRKSVRMP